MENVYDADGAEVPVLEQIYGDSGTQKNSTMLATHTKGNRTTCILLFIHLF